MTPELAEAIAKHREKKERIVFTNGCFDILHVGHIRYLAEARALGDLLVVGINSDSSVRGLKGEERPIVNQDERAEILSSLKSVDYVAIFDQPTPLALIEQVKPDILVKGGDWPVEKIVGADFVHSTGGEVRTLTFHPGHSTTDLLDRIKKL
jgi:D-beta-D-heptose 7-phosphate kinase/D-beta-D-heptose 1-phosphate adenosyltransferase